MQKYLNDKQETAKCEK